jgi:ribosomal protein S2
MEEKPRRNDVLHHNETTVGSGVQFGHQTRRWNPK